MKLYSNQMALYTEIVEGFKGNNKVLLNALCGVGKTIISLYLIRYWISQGKRVAVSCYSIREIRDQWYNKIAQHAPNLVQHLQIICSKKEARQYSSMGVPAICNGAISKTKKLTIFIPQTIREQSLIGKFDAIIIDEAHEYLEVKGGILKRALKIHSNPDTKYLGLSGTGYTLMREGKFFENSVPVIYDLVQGLKDEAVNNCTVIAEYFDFDLPIEYYRPDNNLNKKGIGEFQRNFRNINKEGKKLLKHNAFSTAKIEKIITEIKGKTLVVVPRGTGCEDSLANFINVIKKNHRAAVVKTSRTAPAVAAHNEALFRDPSSQTHFMIVIDMCSTGWDFPGLNNVIDLTFSRNPVVLIQRLARTIRKIKSKPISKYIYCTDQSRSKNRVIYDLGRAITLMTTQGIIQGANEEDISVPESLFKHLCSMVDGKKNSIDPILLDEFLGNKCERIKYVTLQDIKEREESPWNKFWTGIFIKWKNINKEDLINFIQRTKELEKNFKNAKVLLTRVRKKYPGIYFDLFKDQSIEKTLQESGIC